VPFFISVAAGGDLSGGAMSKKKYIILEILGFIGLLMTINLLWFRDDLGFYKFNPNPLWLVIIFTSARYGANWGMLSSLLVGAIYLVLPGEEKAFLSERLPMVASFLIISFFLGSLRDNLEKKLREWRDRVQRQEEELESVHSRYTALDNLRKELEKKVLSQTSTVITLYETAQSLGNLELKELLPTIPRVVKEYIGAEKISLYLREGENFWLKANLGYPADSLPPQRVGITEGVMGKVASWGKTITIRDSGWEAAKEEGKDKGRIMCAPLKSVSGKVMGVINIDYLPFVKFNQASVRMLSVVADWAYRAIENATRYGKAEANRIDDEVAKVYNAKYVRNRLEEEFKKALRYKTVFSTMLIRIEDYALLASGEMKATLLGVLGSAFSLALRTTDIIGRDGNEDGFLMILPFTDEEGAKRVEERLIKSINGFELKPYHDEKRLRFSTGRATFNPQMKSVEDLFRQARENMKKGTRSEAKC